MADPRARSPRSRGGGPGGPESFTGPPPRSVAERLELLPVMAQRVTIVAGLVQLRGRARDGRGDVEELEPLDPPQHLALGIEHEFGAVGAGGGVAVLRRRHRPAQDGRRGRGPAPADPEAARGRADRPRGGPPAEPEPAHRPADVATLMTRLGAAPGCRPGCTASARAGCDRGAPWRAGSAGAPPAGRLR